MAASLQPSACPDCQASLPLDYALRGAARMPRHALVLLIAGAVATTMLWPVLIYSLLGLAGALGSGLGLRLSETQLLRMLAWLVSFLLAFLPAWLSWRYARSRPKLVAVCCPHCSWTGTARLAEWDPLSIARDPENVTPLEAPRCVRWRMS